jgi:hypothetical protein
MRSAAAFALLLAASASAQDLIVAEHGSVGLEPYTKFSYVTRYTSDLQFVRAELTYPLISGSPSAALAVGDVLYVGEGNCPDLGKPCSPRIARHDPSGEAHNIGPPLDSQAKSIRLSPLHELVVTTSTELLRIDLEHGNVVGRFPLNGDGIDADVDPKNGCRAAIGILPTSVLLVDICSLTIQKTIDVPSVWGVRFTPGGDLLVSGRSLLRYDGDGNLLRTYDVPASCRIETAADVLLACGINFFRLDLGSGVVTPAGRMQRGIWADSVAFVEQIAPRRRRVAH